MTRYAVRSGSGGDGQHQGGDGVVREFEFLSEAEVTLLTERRGTNQPWGLNGGSPGASGSQRLDGEKLPAKANFKAQPGQKLRLESPGGGGFGID